MLSEFIDEDYGKDHEDGNDEKAYLSPFLQLASKDDGIQAALFEARGTIFMVVMVVVVMMFCHVTSGYYKAVRSKKSGYW